MNKIVRENYPVGDLPDDLKKGFAENSTVRVTIESRPETASGLDLDATVDALRPPARVMSLEELFALRKPPFRTTDEIVDDVRRQRDEWDD